MSHVASKKQLDYAFREILNRATAGGGVGGVITLPIAWVDVSKAGSSLADIAARSHTLLTDIGSLTHAQIDGYLNQSVKTDAVAVFRQLSVQPPQDTSGQIGHWIKSNNVLDFGVFQTYRQRGTAGVPLDVHADDCIVNFEGLALLGGNWETAAYMAIFVQGVAPHISGYMELRAVDTDTTDHMVMRINGAGGGLIGVGLTLPSAFFHIKAGTAATAAMKLTTGAVLTVPADGALEYDGVHLYFSPGGVRKQIDQQSTAVDARAYRNGSQTNTTTGWQKILLNAETYDAGGNFDSGTNYCFTAPVAGPYTIMAGMEYTTVSACRLGLAAYKGAAIISRFGDMPCAAGKPYRLGGSDRIYLAANDTISLYYYTDASDGGVNGGGAYDTYLAVHLG